MTLVALRAVLMTLVVALALLWLARTLGLWPWFIPALLCSPYLWFYARAIWDNSFNIPLCALSFASAVSFLARGRPWTLVLSLACCVAMVLTHLMVARLRRPRWRGSCCSGRLRACGPAGGSCVLFAAGAAAASLPYLSFLRRSVASEFPVDRSLARLALPAARGPDPHRAADRGHLRRDVAGPRHERLGPARGRRHDHLAARLPAGLGRDGRWRWSGLAAGSAEPPGTAPRPPGQRRCSPC